MAFAVLLDEDATQYRPSGAAKAAKSNRHQQTTAVAAPSAALRPSAARRAQSACADGQ